MLEDHPIGKEAPPQVVVVEKDPVRELAPVTFFGDQTGRPAFDKDQRATITHVFKDDQRDIVSGEAISEGNPVRPVHPNDPARQRMRPQRVTPGWSDPLGEGADNNGEGSGGDSEVNPGNSGQTGTNQGESGADNLAGGLNSANQASQVPPPAPADQKGTEKPAPAKP